MAASKATRALAIETAERMTAERTAVLQVTRPLNTRFSVMPTPLVSGRTPSNSSAKRSDLHPLLMARHLVTATGTRTTMEPDVEVFLNDDASLG